MALSSSAPHALPSARRAGGRSPQLPGADDGAAGGRGAQEASRQEGRLQHRGLAGGGRLGRTLPREGARPELRPHPHEYSKTWLWGGAMTPTPP